MGGLNDYSIIKAIGKGSYGEVHLIQHKQEKKQYVIKKLVLQKASRRERKAAELEAKLLSKLKHPNIISYKDSFESDDGFLYIVMGYAEGGDLYTELRKHRENNEFLSEVRVVRWFIQICMALQYLHQQHILHRDLKTQNIFLTKTKMIKVGDLGIARVLEGASDMATTLIGTPYYMSPELFSNKPYNHKSDVWALGCCVYEMTTLKHAFNAKDMNSLVYKILKKKMPKMPSMYSDELCELIKSMLHQNADMRPSVNKILRNPFIKKHIQLFLDESSKSRRPTSGKTRRTRSEQSSRKTSVSSSRCSSRESVNSVFDHETPKRHVGRENSRPVEPASPSKPLCPAIVKQVVKSENVSTHQDVKAEGKQLKNQDKVYEHAKQLRGQRKPTPPLEKRDDKVDDVRVRSAGSSGSSESGDKQLISKPSSNVKAGNRLSSPKEREESKVLESSSSSIVSIVSASSTRTTSSARERRRARQQRERLSRQQDSGAVVDGASKPTKSPIAPALDAQKLEAQVERLSVSNEASQRKGSSAEELNQFYTLLHTTLKLADDKTESPPVTPTNQDEVDGQLSPVPELSESQQSTKKEDASVKPQDPFAKNTPQATEIDVRVPPHLQQNNIRSVSQATLASTSKLMKRIVVLRKDCIKGLGVPLLHRAYELLDENHEDDDDLEKRLVDLLGEVRFSQWAGKIWQLKFCEESIFQHCGSITAYS